MRTFKTISLAVATAAVMASCGSTASFVGTPISPISPTITKKSSLTEDQLKHWSAMDLVKDTVPGMSVDKAYGELIKNRKGETVIVGVIDSGVDIDHEDLKNVIWTNPGEIAETALMTTKTGLLTISTDGTFWAI